ncbi:MAG TPA: hypothetical protein VF284_11020 [Rhodanobacteraceae bacterium]
MMRKHSIEVLARLSNIREEQAGKRVSEVRGALRSAERRVNTLSAYRRQIARHVEAEITFGQALHALAAFDAVTQIAEQQAQHQTAALRTELAAATATWAARHNERQTLLKKYTDTAHAERRGIEKSEERLAPPARARAPFPASNPGTQKK